MRITTTGFGAWAAGGAKWEHGWGDDDDAMSISAIRHAIEAGVNWIDTAPAYGLGHSEEVVARAISPFAEEDRPLVFTKCGLEWDPFRPSSPVQRFATPASIRAEVEASLRRLRLDRIDLLQVHWPPERGSCLEDYWGTLIDLRAEGKIRAAGLSNHSRPDLTRAEALGHVDVLQPPFSAINRSAAPDIEWCATNGTATIAYSPLQSGLLSGKMTAARAAAIPQEDWRSRSGQFRGDRLTTNLQIADVIAAVAGRHGVETAAAAVAWVLAWPGVTGAIVGARSPDQVDGWIKGASLSLDVDDLTDISAELARPGHGIGPATPSIPHSKVCSNESNDGPRADGRIRAPLCSKRRRQNDRGPD